MLCSQELTVASLLEDIFLLMLLLPDFFFEKAVVKNALLKLLTLLVSAFDNLELGNELMVA